MDRSALADERIRRAEEIYYRRREPDIDRKTARVNVNSEKSNFKLFKKMTIQIVVCLIIYFVFTVIQNSNYIFSEEFLKKANDILSYDINVNIFYDQIKGYIDKEDPNTGEQEQTQDMPPQEPNEEDLGQGGGEEVTATLSATDTVTESPVVEETHEEASSYNQMQVDADSIKARFTFVMPTIGVVSSRFGVRNTDNPIVSKYHSGIDIAANTGTKIIAAIEGTATAAGFESSLGNYIIIKNGDVETLYAHLNKIYIKQGDAIKQSQEIGEVGSTGNSTGPHLHFQIEREDRVIDPEYIMQF